MHSGDEKKAATILEFIRGLNGSLWVTFEEGTSAAWLHDLLKPHVSHLIVCDPRKNALLKDGSKNDRIDARKLAELLRGNQLSAVYHGEARGPHLEGTRAELSDHQPRFGLGDDPREKLCIEAGRFRVPESKVYGVRHRSLWLDKIGEAGVRRRAEFYYQQLDALRSLRQQVRRDLLTESARHQETKRLRQIPSIGPIRAALLVALLQTPHRFRTKRQLWAYSGFGIETHDSGEHRYVDGELRRSKKKATVRGLNRNYNRDLKNLFKGAATQVTAKPGPFQEFYTALLAKGIRPEMARLTLARKIAAISLTIWKKGVDFDPKQLPRQAA